MVYAAADHRDTIKPAMGASELADRLNIFGHEQLRAYGNIVDGVLPGLSPRTGHDYSGGLKHRATARTAPIHPTLSTTSMAARLALLPGEQWWADIGHMHTPDALLESLRDDYTDNLT